MSVNDGEVAGVLNFTSDGGDDVRERPGEVLRVDVDGVNSLHYCCESGGKLKGVSDEWNDDVCRGWGV